MPVPVVRCFTAVQDANAALTVRATPFVSNDTTYIVPWQPDEEPAPYECFQVFFGPEACGDKTRKKFFRGLRFFGSGAGHVMVFVDGVLVCDKVMDLDETPEHSRLVYLPRGTSGFAISALITMVGTLDGGIELLFDPIAVSTMEEE